MDGMTFGLATRSRKLVEMIDDANDTIAKQKTEIIKLRHALALEQADTAGLMALYDAMKKSLIKADPTAQILCYTGRSYDKRRCS